MRMKDKINNLFFEKELVSVSVVGKSTNKKGKFILTISNVLNLVLNILYLSFICYSGDTNTIGFIWFLTSLIWGILSLVASYKLADDIGNNIFYFNVILILFMSKMWFVYL